MSAAPLNIMAYKRVPWTGNVAIVGPDYSTAAFSMQVRQHWGDSGSALLTASISATFDPAYSYWDPRKNTTITAPATVLAMEISEAALEALPYAAEEEKPLELVYDLHVTPSGGVKHIALAGDFVIYPGSTI